MHSLHAVACCLGRVRVFYHGTRSLAPAFQCEEENVPCALKAALFFGSVDRPKWVEIGQSSTTGRGQERKLSATGKQSFNWRIGFETCRRGNPGSSATADLGIQARLGWQYVG